MKDRPIKVIAAAEIFRAPGEAIEGPDSAWADDLLSSLSSSNEQHGRKEKAIHFLIYVSIIPFSQWGSDHCVQPFLFRRD